MVEKKCPKCSGLGWYCIKTTVYKDMIQTCEPCKIIRQGKLDASIASAKKREIYSDSNNFMDNEASIQFESDYPTSNDIRKANGSEC